MTETTIRDFESALTELEQLVQQLENGDLTLEKSLQLFERGVELSRYCHTQLETAERRLEILDDRGQVTEPPASLTESDNENEP